MECNEKNPFSRYFLYSNKSTGKDYQINYDFIMKLAPKKTTLESFTTLDLKVINNISDKKYLLKYKFITCIHVVTSKMLDKMYVT